MDRIRHQGGLPMQFAPDVHDVASVDERRKHQRYRVNIAAKCFIDGVEPIKVVVIDISEGGYGLNCALPVRRGTKLAILFPEAEMTFRASVVWKSETRCGLQLLPSSGHVSEVASDKLADLLEKIATKP